MMRRAISAAMMSKQKGKPDCDIFDVYIPIYITFNLRQRVPMLAFANHVTS